MLDAAMSVVDLGFLNGDTAKPGVNYGKNPKSGGYNNLFSTDQSTILDKSYSVDNLI